MLWLKADAGVTTDGGGLVTQWNDQSGFGNHALGTVAPSFVPSAVNGMPAIHFDGSSQLMDIPTSPSLTDNGDLSVVAVISADSLATALNHNVLSKTPANQPASFDMQIVRTTGKPNFVRGNGSSSSSAQANAGVVANQFYIVEAVMRGTNGSYYLNGNFNGSGTHVAGLNDWGNSIRLGIRQDNGTKLLGNLAEAMLFRSAISDSERSQLENYLGAKYGDFGCPAGDYLPACECNEVGRADGNFCGNRCRRFAEYFLSVAKELGQHSQCYKRDIHDPTLALTDNNAAFRVLVYTALGITNTSDPADIDGAGGYSAAIDLFGHACRSGADERAGAIFGADQLSFRRHGREFYPQQRGNRAFGGAGRKLEHRSADYHRTRPELELPTHCAEY